MNYKNYLFTGLLISALAVTADEPVGAVQSESATQADQVVTMTEQSMEVRSVGGIEEVVVTAQKREQSLQDTPIALTAITASTIEDLAKAILSISNKDHDNYKIIGTRHGEKEYETLLSREEFTKAQSLDNYFRVSPDTRDLNYEKYFSTGKKDSNINDEFNSFNTKFTNCFTVYCFPVAIT